MVRSAVLEVAALREIWSSRFMDSSSRSLRRGPISARVRSFSSAVVTTS